MYTLVKSSKGQWHHSWAGIQLNVHLVFTPKCALSQWSPRVTGTFIILVRTRPRRGWYLLVIRVKCCLLVGYSLYIFPVPDRLRHNEHSLQLGPSTSKHSNKVLQHAQLASDEENTNQAVTITMITQWARRWSQKRTQNVDPRRRRQEQRTPGLFPHSRHVPAPPSAAPGITDNAN